MCGAAMLMPWEEVPDLDPEVFTHWRWKAVWGTIRECVRERTDPSMFLVYQKLLESGEIKDNELDEHTLFVDLPDELAFVYANPNLMQIHTETIRKEHDRRTVEQSGIQAAQAAAKGDMGTADAALRRGLKRGEKRGGVSL